MSDPLEERHDDGQGAADSPLIVGGWVGAPPDAPLQRLEWEGRRLPGRLPPALGKVWKLLGLASALFPLILCLGYAAVFVFGMSPTAIFGPDGTTPEDSSDILSEAELHAAEARLEAIYQNGDLAACSEFKGKRYADNVGGGAGYTELFYSCVYNLSLAFQDEAKCLSLSDPYATRICLHALAAFYDDPRYCEQADAYARDEVASELYPMAATNMCYQHIYACEPIREVEVREHCLMERALKAEALEASLCRSFSDPKMKDDCFTTAAVYLNDPGLCRETSSADDCYWTAALITIPNLGLEAEVKAEGWCERIERAWLRASCLAEAGG